MTYRRLTKTLLIAILSVFLIGGSPYTNDYSRDTSYNSLSRASTETKMSPKVVASVTAAIRAAGYNCPLAKVAFFYGYGAYGTVTKIYCGPLNQPGVYEKAAFRVVIHPNNSARVKPW